MSAPTEQEIRDNIAKWSVGREHRVLPWTQKRFAFLLELLDAERARADAAEAREAKFNHILNQYEAGTISKVACVSLMLNVI